MIIPPNKSGGSKRPADMGAEPDNERPAQRSKLEQSSSLPEKKTEERVSDDSSKSESTYKPDRPAIAISLAGVQKPKSTGVRVMKSNPLVNKMISTASSSQQIKRLPSPESGKVLLSGANPLKTLPYWNNDSLRDHAMRHIEDTNSKDTDHYEEKSLGLLNAPVSNSKPGYIRKNGLPDGSREAKDVIREDVSEKTIAVAKMTGEVRTYHSQATSTLFKRGVLGESADDYKRGLNQEKDKKSRFRKSSITNKLFRCTKERKMERVDKKRDLIVEPQKYENTKSYTTYKYQPKSKNNLANENVYDSHKKKSLVVNVDAKMKNALIIDKPKKKKDSTQNKWRTIHDLKMAIRGLGKDVISEKSLESLMQKSFRNRTPYVLAQIFTKLGDCQYADGKSLCDKIHLLKNIKPNSIFQELFSVPVNNIVFIGMVPWTVNGSVYGSFDNSATKDSIFNNEILFISGANQSSWPRGLAYARSSLGIEAEKDPNLAEYLFSKATVLEKKKSLNAALVYSATAGAPKLIDFLLNNGAEVAPAIQSDNFLPLTLAVKAGRIETVKLMLKAGADPRQCASWSHGTAFSWSEEYPEIKQILIESLKSKNIDFVLRPSLDGTWEPYRFIDNEFIRVTAKG